MAKIMQTIVIDTDGFNGKNSTELTYILGTDITNKISDCQ